MTEEKRSIELEVKEALEIHLEDITGDLVRHPSLYFYWGSMWAKASRARRKQRLLVKETEARLANELRRQVSGGDPKARVTEAMVNNYLFQQPEYLAAEQDLIQKEYMEEVLDVARYGFGQRGSALQELAKANRAEEFYGNEFSAMKTEFEAREKVALKKRGKKDVNVEEIAG